MPEIFRPQETRRFDIEKFLKELNSQELRNEILNFFRSRQIPEAEDMAQEVLLRASSAIKESKFNGDSQLKTWLYQIARNLLIDKLRRAKHKSSKGLVDEIPQAAEAIDQELDAETKLIREMTKKQALDALSPEKRSVIELLLQGYSYQEIATILDIPKGTVKSRILYAKKALNIK